MAEAKPIDTGVKAADADADAAAADMKKAGEYSFIPQLSFILTLLHLVPFKLSASFLFVCTVKWMVVYTNYGYGEVDLVEFKKSI